MRLSDPRKKHTGSLAWARLYLLRVMHEARGFRTEIYGGDPWTRGLGFQGPILCTWGL